ncbi:MAG: homoserine dehydrogenase [Vicinamibacterales bacterium]
MRVALLLIGFGNVARRFVQLLREQEAFLRAHDVEPVIVGICTRRHGYRFVTADEVGAGLDAVRLAQQVAGGDAVGPTSTQETARQLIAQLVSLPRPAGGAQDIEAHVVVETTTLAIESGEPAVSHVRAALRAGAHVVSANKGPVAHAYHELAQEAAAAGRHFLFEGAVMDGIPIFNLVRSTMPGVTIEGFRGVINSTTNHILTALEAGEPFESALARMQAEGIAEADPSLDVDGWDAAAKVAALGNVWMDARITPQDVVRAGIGPETALAARAALSRGRRLKLVGSGKRRRVAFSSEKPPDVLFCVGLEVHEPDDPQSILDGPANALEVQTDPLGRVVITQRDGGLEKTAYALFADLMTIVGQQKKDVGWLFR